MEITDIDFTLLENGDVLLTVTILVANIDPKKAPISVDLSQEIPYDQWATASLLIALGDRGEDNEDPDDDGTRH